MNIEEHSFEDAIQTAKEYLVDIHLAENNRSFPGTGTMPWDRIIGTLKEIGYEKAAVIRPFEDVKPGSNGGVRGSADPEKLDGMAKESLEFVRALIDM